MNRLSMTDSESPCLVSLRCINARPKPRNYSLPTKFSTLQRALERTGAEGKQVVRWTDKAANIVMIPPGWNRFRDRSFIALQKLMIPVPIPTPEKNGITGCYPVPIPAKNGMGIATTLKAALFYHRHRRCQYFGQSDRRERG